MTLGCADSTDAIATVEILGHRTSILALSRTYLSPLDLDLLLDQVVLK